MARVRNYPEEYRARKATGIAAGKTAVEYRGHTSTNKEREQRQVNTAIKRAAAGVPLKPYRDDNGNPKAGFRAVAKDQLANLQKMKGDEAGRTAFLEEMKRKYEVSKTYKGLIEGGASGIEAAEQSRGRELWEGRDEDLPEELFYYHDV